MSEPLTLEKLAQTVEDQATQLVRLNARLEDLEDLRDLQEAIARNAGRPLQSWETVREELGCTDDELARLAARERHGWTGGGVLTAHVRPVVARSVRQPGN